MDLDSHVQGLYHCPPEGDDIMGTSRQGAVRIICPIIQEPTTSSARMAGRHQLRNRLLRLIAQNPGSIYPSLFDAIYLDDSTTKEESNNDSNVTPLMTACDQSLETPLLHLRQKIGSSHKDSNDKSINQLVDAWGHPTETSTSKEGANSAAHHALAAGFSFGLDTIEYFYNCCEQHNKCGKSPVESFHCLISQPNANGDTPIMMAAVFGRTSILQHVIERHLELSIDELNRNGDDLLNDSTKVGQIWQSVQDIFAIRNEDGLSAINLSCGHGRVETVKLLTQSICVKICSTGKSCKVSVVLDNDATDERQTYEHCFKLKPLVQVSYDDAKFCQSSIQDLEAELLLMKQQQKVNDVHLDAFIEQRNKICKCQEILNEAMNRAAANAVNDLMSGDMLTSSTPNTNCKRKKGKKLKKRDKLVPSAKPESHNILEEELTPPPHGKVTNEVVENQSPFVTLQNGLVVSKTHKPDDIEPMNDDDDPVPNNDISAPRSLQNVLKSQLKQQQQPKETSPNDPNEAFNIEAQMDSLCLDPSMLLLSSHGMAMELSPSQLETMQVILLHQLNAAKEAQSIQKRLLSQNKE
ncbi:hypothetical protein ACHAXN_005121 [Cyclotella atomus]